MRESQLLSSTEAARLINRAQSTVAGWFAAGHLEATAWVGRTPLFAAADVRRVAAAMEGKRRHATEGKIRPPRGLPAEATTTPPGSPDRILVYQQRYSRAEFLFHPGDTRLTRRAA